MRRDTRSALGLLLLTVLVFFDVLIPPITRILSAPGTDLQTQFVHWRQFGFSELRNGNLPLWNPHIYSGTPFMTGFQSALFYPLNWIFMLLPLPTAVNVSIALHIWLAGLFMCHWANARGLHPLASFAAGAMFMFCGPHYLHVYAGHLPNLCSMVWVPLIFCAVDRAFDRTPDPSARWTAGAKPVLLGAAAVSLQILAGHPQYVYYTAVAVTGYSIVQTIRHPVALRSAALVVTMYLFGALLAAVQLLPGMMAIAENVRGSGLTEPATRLFSFAPENLLTMLAPHFFDTGADYWGRSYYWEMSLFFSVSGLSLALLGSVVIERRSRWIALSMIGTLLLLALGHRTPLYPALRDALPGFDVFRGASKFTLPAIVFVILLAAGGLSHLMQGGRVPAVVTRTMVVAAITLGLAGGLIYTLGASPRGWWAQALLGTFDTGEVYHPVAWYRSPDVVRTTAHTAGIGLMLAAITAGAVAVILRSGRTRVYAALPLIIALELLVFARVNRPVFSAAPPITTPVVRQLGADRIFNQNNPNAPMTSGALSITGYDPGITRRYAEIVAHTQGRDPDRIREQLAFQHIPPLFAMLRARGAGSAPFPQAFLAHRHKVITSRDDIFAALPGLSNPHGHPIILEQEPLILPQAATGPETVTIVEQSTDHLVIEIDLSANGLLVITDGFATGWSARSETGHHPVVPANYVLRAIALPKGQHRLTLRYEPPGYALGRCLSLVSLAIFAALGIAVFRTNHFEHRN